MKDMTNGSGTPPDNGSAGNGNTGNGNSGNDSGLPGGIMPFFISNSGSGQEEPDISEIFINYNEKYKNAAPVQFRDSVISDAMGILIGKVKPNPLLIGPAGTGKTAIVQDIARRIAQDDPYLPDDLKGCTIYELPLGNLMAGTAFRGMLQEKLNAVIAFATDPDNKAILFIDEIHTVLDRGGENNTVSQLLKPALARSDMHLIGATTSQEASVFLKDPAFNRRFSKVVVNELEKHETIPIVKKAREKYLGTGICIPDNIVEAVVNDADEYRCANSHRPDGALTLLDRSVSFKIMQVKETEKQLKDNPSALAAFQAVASVTLTENDVRSTAMRLISGGQKMPETDETSLRDAFSVIKGQDAAVDTVVKRILRRQKNLFPMSKPLTFLFTGASGVGKTKVTEILARQVTGTKPVTLNMTEYQSEASITEIIGSPDGFVGSDSKRELPFDILETNPYQVILLDEFEKCDRSVQRLFMSVFDEGILTTARGKVLDFSKAIIIATTNAGCTEGNTISGFGKSTDETADIKKLEKSFDTELLNRFTCHVKFGNIPKDVYRDIVENVYASMVADLKSRRRKVNLPDTIDAAVLEDIVTGTYRPEFGARPVKDAVQDYIEENV